MTLIIYYISLFALLFIAEWAYITAARSKGFAVTKHLSSRQSVSVTGGGIIFFPAIAASLLCSAIAPPEPEFIIMTAALAVLWVVSYVDDLRNLSPLPRLCVQFVAAACVMWPFYAQLGTWYYLLGILFVTSVTNTFNFMDGICGMLTIYSIVVTTTLLYIVVTFPDNSIAGMQVPLIGLLIALCVFAWFNFIRTDEVFSGDVGAIIIGFFIAFTLVLIITTSFNVWYITLISVYLVDAGLTLLKRIVYREHILQSHHQHLYQRLVRKNSLKHLPVAITYGGVQLIINICMLALQPDAWGIYSVAVFGMLIIAYIVISKTKA